MGRLRAPSSSMANSCSPAPFRTSDRPTRGGPIVVRIKGARARNVAIERGAAVDQGADPPRSRERFARDRGQILEFQQRLFVHQRIVGKMAFQHDTVRKVADPPDAMDDLHLRESVVDVGIARETEEGRKSRPRRKQEQPPAGEQRVGV